MTAADRLRTLSPDARAATLAALDDLSRPLTGRDIDQALIGHMSRSQRRALSRGLLEAFDVIAIKRR